MEFTCCNCGKPIQSIAYILDKAHFLHEECKEEYLESLIKEALDDTEEEELEIV